LSIVLCEKNGNGNRHRTPFPGGLRKIKIISFKAFLDLKELFNNFKGRELIFLSNRAPLIKDLRPRIHLPWPVVNEKQIKHDNAAQAYIYEPSKISSAYNSLFWQWRRVAEWHRYINDPYENINGHIIT